MRAKERDHDRERAREYITAGSRQVPNQYGVSGKRVQVDDESQVHEGGQEYKAKKGKETERVGKGNLKRRRRTNEQFSYSADSVTTGVRY